MTGLELRYWAVAWGFNHQEAAEAIGIGRSTFCKYLKEVAVPENVRLATMGYDAEKMSLIETKYTLLKRKYDAIEKIVTGKYP